MKITIYQMKETTHKFKSYEWLEKDGVDVVKDFDNLYNKVYVYNNYTSDTNNVYEVLEDLFCIFNLHHPSDYRGHSLSTSDVIDVDGVKYFCDSVGWKKLN